jgi:hypothetical protein
MSTLELDGVFPELVDGESKPLARIYGVRHLSPGAAAHLKEILQVMKPTAVLVEGPSDATDLLKHLVHKDTRPPVALLAYTRQRPVRSILYPMASYSPEWVAITWGIRNNADTRLIDLPASVFLQLHEPDEEHAHPAPEAAPPTPPAEPPDTRRRASEHTLAYLDDPWEAIAKLSGDPDHETWWERHFEHTQEPAAYVRQIHEFGKGLRALRELNKDDENLIREAYMRRCIREVLAKGHKPENVLVVCGAFHSSALVEGLPTMTDQEVKKLPRVDCSLTLMPYSYYRLSSQSGYGAGNHAPAYYQKLFHEREAGAAENLSAQFLTQVCHLLRKAGQVRSAAEVIEAVRLARTLAALAESPAPCLRDLRDAALTCLGRGEWDVIAPHLHDLEVGSAVGRLPRGVSRTSIQDNFYLLLEELKLTKFQTEKTQELELDLREDRFAKTPEGAFRDRNRSTFFHRLQVLGIQFAEKQRSRQDQATWKEIWDLRWKPESEIQLVEKSLLGDSVEMAAAIRLSQKLSECTRIDQAAEIVKEAVVCELADSLENARRRLQAMAVEETGFTHLARAIEELGETITMGSVRKFDPQPLKPLLSQLFLRATLAARDACLCDDGVAREDVKPAFVRLNDVATSPLTAGMADTDRWNVELNHLATHDHYNAYLSGFVLSMILPRFSEDDLAREVNRRLSVGVPPDIGSSWFEGLVQYNREALFHRLALWRQLDAYVTSLDDAGFRQALVPLRRALSDFGEGQVRRVVNLLAEISAESAEELKASVDSKLSDEELRKLDEELGDLDFGL